MEWFVDNWTLVVAFVAGCTCLVTASYHFMHWPTNKQLMKVKEWLVYACLQAEKELGQGTGQMKLRMVYDMFLTKFSWLSKVITFDQFSLLVDEALVTMRHMLDNNQNVAAIVMESKE